MTLKLDRIWEWTHWGGSIKGCNVKLKAEMEVLPNTRKRVTTTLNRIGTHQGASSKQAYIYYWACKTLGVPYVKWNHHDWLRNNRRGIDVSVRMPKNYVARLNETPLPLQCKIEGCDFHLYTYEYADYETLKLEIPDDSLTHSRVYNSKYPNKELGKIMRRWLGPLYPEGRIECPETIFIEIDHDNKQWDYRQ